MTKDEEIRVSEEAKGLPMKICIWIPTLHIFEMDFDDNPHDFAQYT